MKQVLQSARTGVIEVAEVPMPRVQPGCVLVRIAASLVSAGTERAVSEFASKSLAQKAKSRPDLVRDVFAKVKRDGLLAAFSAVRTRLDQPLALGYSSAGTVIEADDGITDLRPGDRVACAGANFAVHAEFAVVPRMLVTRIPSAEIDFAGAAFTTLGAVALHSVRTAEAKLGNTVAVIGLGLLGQLTVQLLRAAGCRVIGFDLQQSRAELACKMGAHAATGSESEFQDLCFRHSGGNGVDSVLIAAETPSSGPVNLASAIARDRGIIVAVGNVGMELQRRLYYEKELDFRVSRSYGPGRYDAAFEQKGRDYPIGYVRWTETRNMQAFLELLADGRIDPRSLITHSFHVENAVAAYDLISGKTQEPYLGVVIRYPDSATESATSRLELITRRKTERTQTEVRVGVLGAGNFAQGVLIPAMRKAPGTSLVGLCSATGAHARAAATKFAFEFCTTDEGEIFSNPTINTVVIATRHHLHAAQVIRALESGKHVFCEKPLCLTAEELDEVRCAYEKSDDSVKLMVGFNRRFAPMARKMKDFFHGFSAPLSMHYRVNAGSLPQDHWINDPELGGGRVLGEVCHFVDFLSFLCGATPRAINARGLPGSSGEQDVFISLDFADGSRGTIQYLCSGDRSFSKERIEVFGGGSVAVLDDFRCLQLVRDGRQKSFRSWLKQDKGHKAEWLDFAASIRAGAPPPISADEIFATTLATIRVAESLRSGREQSLTEAAAQFLAPLVS